MAADQPVVVLVTCGDDATAREIASVLVEKKLAACVSIVPGVTSIYRWQGKIERGEEILLIIKTAADLLEVLMTEVKTLHPYEVPEILSVPIEGGWPPYLEWIQSSVHRPQDPKQG